MLADVLKARGIAADPEPIKDQVVFVEADGTVTPLLSDEASRALFADERLRDRKAEITARRVPSLPYPPRRLAEGRGGRSDANARVFLRGLQDSGPLPADVARAARGRWTFACSPKHGRIVPSAPASPLRADSRNDAGTVRKPHGSCLRCSPPPTLLYAIAALAVASTLLSFACLLLKTRRRGAIADHNAPGHDL